MNKNNEKSKSKKIKILRRILISILLIIAVLTTTFYVYTSDYYKAYDVAYAAEESDDNVDVYTIDGSTYVFSPNGEIKAGIIFYPGGKVENTAYAPLLHELAKNGILCILVKMPRNLAILDINAANGLQDYFPDINEWYMCGHSLGGACAAMYIKKNSSQYSGLILLASYSTKDISNTDLDVLCIYGSNDGVMKKDSYEECRKNLPSDYSEVIIDGGCHAFFGCYGLQDGDGTATISNEEQINLTVEAIVDFVSE